jgi:type II secretion system protein N
MARFSMSPETKSKVLKGVLYSTLFFFSFLLFIYFTFPWDRLVALGVRMAEDRAKLTIEIKGFSPSYGTGVVADEVTIITKPPAGDKDPTTYVLNNVSARISLWSLITGSYRLTFEGELLGGSVEGDVSLSSSNDKSMALSLSGIDLAQISLVSGYIGLPVKGRIGGEVNLEIPSKGLRTANGTVALRIEGGKVGEAGAKLDPSKHGGRKTPGYDTSITLQEGAALGTFVCNIDIKDGKGDIQEFGAAGGDVEASMTGSLLLRDGFVNSVLSGVFKFRFDEGYVERNKMSLFLTAPDLAQAKTDDGFFAFNINDPINRLKFKPSKREGIKGVPNRAIPGNNDVNPSQVPKSALGPAVNVPTLPTPQPEVFPDPKENKAEELEKKLEEEKKQPEVEEKKPETEEKKPEGDEKKDDEKPATPD